MIGFPFSIGGVQPVFFLPLRALGRALPPAFAHYGRTCAINRWRAR